MERISPVALKYLRVNKINFEVLPTVFIESIQISDNYLEMQQGLHVSFSCVLEL
jgi:hypothetical protein